MREVSVANDGIQARCWQNPCGCGAADLTVEDNFVNGMSGRRGWAVPAGLFFDIKSGLWSPSILPLQVHKCLCLDSQRLGFWDNQSSVSGLDPQVGSGQQHLVPIPRLSVIRVFAQPLCNCQIRKVQFVTHPSHV